MNLRIYRDTDPNPGPTDPTKAYLERLVKLIPGEVVALYLAGKQILLTGAASATSGSPPAADKAMWIAWTIFCLVAIVLVRAFATRTDGKPVQWAAVAIAAASYVIWVYTMGDVFTYTDLWNPKVAGLLMLGWTFIIPLVYKGD